MRWDGPRVPETLPKPPLRASLAGMGTDTLLTGTPVHRHLPSPEGPSIKPPVYPNRESPSTRMTSGK